jgi:hypothetical protein
VSTSVKKKYYLQDNIGRARYTVNFYDGQSKHKDGSDFFALRIFKNKKDVARFVKSLHHDGYVYTR